MLLTRPYLHGKVWKYRRFTEGNNGVLKADYIVGLTDGEGCFLAQLRKDCRIVLRYFITQRFDNKFLLDKVREFFQVGYVYRKAQGNEERQTTFVFEVTKQDEIHNVIVPFFKKHLLQGVKKESFVRFSKIAEIVKGRQNTRLLENKELREVWQLKLTMNTLGNTLARPVPEIGTPGPPRHKATVDPPKLKEHRRVGTGRSL